MAKHALSKRYQSIFFVVVVVVIFSTTYFFSLTASTFVRKQYIRTHVYARASECVYLYKRVSEKEIGKLNGPGSVVYISLRRYGIPGY